MRTAPGQPLGKLILPPAKQGAGPAPGGGGLDNSDPPGLPLWCPWTTTDTAGTQGPALALSSCGQGGSPPRKPAARPPRAEQALVLAKRASEDRARLPRCLWTQTGPLLPAMGSCARSPDRCRPLLPSDLLRGRSPLRLCNRRTESTPRLPPSPPRLAQPAQGWDPVMTGPRPPLVGPKACEMCANAADGAGVSAGPASWCVQELQLTTVTNAPDTSTTVRLAQFSPVPAQGPRVCSPAA